MNEILGRSARENAPASVEPGKTADVEFRLSAPRGCRVFGTLTADDRPVAGARKGPGPCGLTEPVVRRLRRRRPDRRKVLGTPADIEAAILEQVRVHGRLTRSEVVAEHGLGPDQAKNLLADMARRGVIEARESGRGACYERAPRKLATAHSGA